VFPNPHDTPTILTQNVVHATVSFLVCGEFLFPERSITGRGVAMSPAAMPETAVNKNRQFCNPENEVWFSKDELTASPSRDVVTTK
jgi:hypothetical protein